MRQFLSFVCVVAALFCLFGCTNQAENFKDPVDVFYCTSPIKYNSLEGVFARERRDFAGWSGNLQGFLNEYVTGPKSNGLTSPFPLGALILTLEQEETAISLLLNIHFSRLSPNELTLACACLSLTLFQLTNAESVSFQIDGASEDRAIITMTRENLSLMDAIEKD